MELVKKGGAEPDFAKPLKEVAKEAPREKTVYVCTVHPEEVSDKPGQCFKDT